jgi:replicative DNA helicase
MENAELPMHLLDSEAERFVLGSVIKGGWSQFHAVQPLLSEDDLAVHEHKKIWRLACIAAEAGVEPSHSSVMRFAMERREPLTFAALLDVTEHAVPDIAIAPWVTRLRRLAIDREAFSLGEVIRIHTEKGLSTQGREILDAREKLANLERLAVTGRAQSGTFANLIEDCGGLDQLFAIPQGVIEPPFPLLRSLMNGGFSPGTVTVLGARPSVGKSAFAIQTALAAAGCGHKTAVFSLEMQKPEIAKRLFAMGGIDYGRLVRGTLDREDRGRIRHTEQQLSDWPLEIFCDLHDLRSIAAKLASGRPKYEFGVIDYLGLVESNHRAENRNQELSYVSRRVKLLAMETGIPLLVLHQLNRGSEADNRRPELKDLRDSGSIEQDADNVLFIHQCRKDAKDQRELIVAKQRNGQRDRVINMRFIGNHVKFEERGEETERMAS